MSERRSGRFGWVLIGFGLGMLTTFAAIFFLNLADDRESPDDLDAPMAADQAAAAAMQSSPPANARPSSLTEAAAPLAETTAVAPTAPPESQPRPAAPPALDPQVAEDAAATGMTSRAR